MIKAFFEANETGGFDVYAAVKYPAFTAYQLWAQVSGLDEALDWLSFLITPQ